jgi:hypothetical protein
MRTVRFNRRALTITALIAIGLLLLTISHVSSTFRQQVPAENVQIGRDALLRRRVEDEKLNDPKKLIDNDNADHQDADIAAEKHDDFVDEPRKHVEIGIIFGYKESVASPAKKRVKKPVFLDFWLGSRHSD